MGSMVSEGDTVRRRRQEKEGKEKKTTRDPIPSMEKEEVLEKRLQVMVGGPVEQEELAEKLEKLLERNRLGGDGEQRNLLAAHGRQQLLGQDHRGRGLVCSHGPGCQPHRRPGRRQGKQFQLS